MEIENKVWYIRFDLMPKDKQDVAFEKLTYYLSKVGEDNQKTKMKGLQLRTKWLVEHVTDHGMYGGTPHKRVKLNTVYSHDKNHEDNQFSNATPSGDCTQVITAPSEDVQGFFKPGVKYYAVWQECEDQS